MLCLNIHSSSFHDSQVLQLANLVHKAAMRATGNSHFEIAEFPLPTENIPKTSQSLPGVVPPMASNVQTAWRVHMIKYAEI